MKIRCPQCNNKQFFWPIADGRFKCRQCYKKFNFTKIIKEQKLIKQVIQEFLLEHSTNIILSRVNISKYKLLKILTLLRIEMTKDIPDVFEGIVEVDEIYLGGKWKNKSLKIKQKLGKSKRGRGTLKQPVFGILCRNGKVYAEIVEGVEAKGLQPLIEKQVKKALLSVLILGAVILVLLPRDMCIV